MESSGETDPLRRSFGSWSRLRRRRRDGSAGGTDRTARTCRDDRRRASSKCAQACLPPLPSPRLAALVPRSPPLLPPLGRTGHLLPLWHGPALAPAPRLAQARLAPLVTTDRHISRP